MTSKSSIEWTEHTWNPTTGCTKVSPGCKHCYALTLSKRLQAMGAPGYENGFALSLMPERLSQPLHRKKATKYFVNSMSDLFHPGIRFGYIDKVFEVIRQTPQHRYQILTKRPERMARYFTKRKVPTNVWLGVSVEDKKYGVPRIDVLRHIDASIRFLSCEPLLENLGDLDLTDIHWVIAGGESGAKARPMKQDWVLAIKEQCQRVDVAFFFKQWGMWGVDGVKRNKKANGRELQGQIWDEYPEEVMDIEQVF